MGGLTTNYALPYPTMRDVVDDSSWSALANAIDTQLTAVDAKRTAALQRPTAMISTNSYTGVAAGANTTIHMSFEEWDNASLVNLGSDDAAITLTTPGLWLAWANVQIDGPFTTITSLKGIILQDGVAMYAEKMGGTTAFAHVNVMGMLYTSAPNSILRCQALWTGTGGPSDFSARLGVVKIRSI